jgi:hypothetical protein
MPDPCVSSPAVYQLRVVLCGVSPLVRRRLLVASKTKLMQVAVGPAHGHLKDLVQAIEFDAAGDLKPPPDGRLAAAQRDFEFVEG